MWPHAPALLPDELLSSWLVRAGLEQGVDPLVVTGLLWPHWRCWTQDLDRGLDDERLGALRDATGVAPARWRSATLAPLIGSLYEIPAVARGSWRWVTTLGGRNRHRRGGLQCCPACLRGDATPHFRRPWRLAWHTLCERHGQGLADRCPACRAPLEPHRLEAFDGSADVCATCKRPFEPSAGGPALPGASSLQHAADSVLAGRGGVAHGDRSSAPDWFALLAFHAGVVRRAAYPNDAALRRALATLGREPVTLDVADRGIELESLAVGARMRVLDAAWALMSAERETLVGVLKTAGVTRRALCPKGTVVPAALEPVVQALSERTAARTPRTRSSPSGPRSRRSVEARFARLARRIERKR